MICPICNGKTTIVNSIKLLGLIDSSTYHCTNCKVFFRAPLPNDETIAKYYASRYFRYSDKIEEEMAKIQGSFIIHHLGDNANDFHDINYLEIGAGRGWLISYLKKSKIFKSTIGIEPDTVSVEWGRANLKVDLRSGMLNPNDFEKIINEFPNINFISLVHVFEHLNNPLNFLASIRKLVYPHYLFLEVPDGKYEGPIMEIDTFPWSSMGQHFWSFSEMNLRFLLENNGYEIINLTHDGNPKYWDNHYEYISIWNDYFSDVKKRYNMGKLSLKSALYRDLNLFYRIGLLQIKRTISPKFSRLDLPIIRLLARTKEKI